MKQDSSNANTSAKDENKYKLTRGHIASLIIAPLLAILIYWLTIPQGALIAGTLAITVFAAVLWLTEALPLPVTALLIPVGLTASLCSQTKEVTLESRQALSKYQRLAEGVGRVLAPIL